MHFFTIGAMFRDEAHILKEWIEHYLFHGVDHIYLINDRSTDNFRPIVAPYIEQGRVTMYEAPDIPADGKQNKMYNKFFQKHLRATRWFGIFDLDEFLYSPQTINIKEILRR